MGDAPFPELTPAAIRELTPAERKALLGDLAARLPRTAFTAALLRTMEQSPDEGYSAFNSVVAAQPERS